MHQFDDYKCEDVKFIGLLYGGALKRCVLVWFSSPGNVFLMVYCKSSNEAWASSHMVEVNDRNYALTGYIGAAPTRGQYMEGAEVNDNGLPQGFLVQQPPGAVTKPHFHETKQFQVIVDGEGIFGKQRIAPISIQYANAHTPYGPIISGEHGITYFTLRSRWDPGAKYMPASSDKLVKGRQRSKLVAGVPSDLPSIRLNRKAPTLDSIIAKESDGLAAWRLCLGPWQISTVVTPVNSGGQYMIVSEGAMLFRGSSLTRLSLLFLTAGEEALRVVAGEEGLDLVILQFPNG